MYHALMGALARVKRASKGFVVFGIAMAIAFGGFLLAPPGLAATQTTTVTPSSSVISISADTASAVGGSSTHLSDLMMAESGKGDIKGSNGTIILTVPDGFIFDTDYAVTVKVSAGDNNNSDKNINHMVVNEPVDVVMTSGSLTFTVTSQSTGAKNVLLWENIYVMPTIGTTLSSGSVTITGTSITNGTLFSNTTPYILTEVVGEASKLAFLQEPTTSLVDATISPAVTVQIQDQFGNPTTDTSDVALAIETNPSDGILTGGDATSAISGTSTFDSLSIDTAGSGYTLTASSDGLLSATSSSFGIQVQPLLHIVKVVINDNGGTATAGDFSFMVNDGDSTSFIEDEEDASSGQNDVNVDAGEYEVTETVYEGYDVSYSEDCSGTIANDQEATCTITNDDIAPIVTIKKHVINDNGGTALASDWTMDVTGGNTSDTGFAGSEEGVDITLDAGAFSIDESGGVDNYDQSFDGDCSGTLAVGDEKTCTIINDDIAPLLTIKKIAIGGDDVFDFTVTGPGDDTSVLDDPSIETTDGEGTVTLEELDLSAGHYTVNELEKEGWDLNSTSCTKEDILRVSFAVVEQSVAGSAGFTAEIGDNWVCTFTDTNRGSITVYKDIVAPDGTTDVEDGQTFTAHLNGGEGNTLGEDQSVTYDNLVPGDYIVTEDADENYGFVSFSQDGDSETAGAQITLGAGEDIEITITNAQKQGSLFIKKIVTNPNGGTATAGQFSFQINDDQPISFIEAHDALLGENDFMVDPGEYTITETPPEGAYAISYNNCQITVESNGQAGEESTCTITNSDIPDGYGAITVIKSVINDNGGDLTAEDFNLTLTYNNGDEDVSVVEGYAQSGQSYFLEHEMTYTIGEVDPSELDYTQSSIVCTSGEDTTTDGTVVLEDQKAWECTITNDDIAPSLTLVKKVINDDGGTAVATDFTVMAKNGADETVLSGAGQVSSDETFQAGTYTLSESGLEGYTAGGWECTNEASVGEGNEITLVIGQSTTCTITNDDQPATLTVIKETDEASGNGTFDFNVASSGETTPFSDTFSLTTQEYTATTESITLKKGSYDVTEEASDGWYMADVSCVYDDESVGEAIETGKTITVNNGSNIICTFTNTKQGTLIVKKVVVNDDDGTRVASDFSFMIDDGEAIVFESDGQNNIVVEPGTYSVTEVSDEGYTTEYDNCTEIEVPAGGSATCTITNDDFTPTETTVVVDDEMVETVTDNDNVNVIITIPVGTTVTGPVGWDGIINTPTITTTFTAPTPDEGFASADLHSAIEIGAGDLALTFDKAVKITFQGEANRFVGWSRGGTFTNITSACKANTQEAGDAMADGSDCRINVGSDLIVWTKHFTVFVTYTQTATTSASTSGGGSGGLIIFPSNPSTTTTTQAPIVPIPFPSPSFPSPRVLGAETENVIEIEKSLTGTINTTLAKRLSGRILLQVETLGQAWYINPADQSRYFLGRPADALDLMRRLGIGITDANLEKLKTDKVFAAKHAGKIFIQVESKGEAWYVNPLDNTVYALGRPADALMLMQKFGLGITNADIRKITVGELK
ncbi:MAG: hypothetical protein Q8P11_02460 [bacterium]|nr:hypothetical protein [bacterium]